MVALVLGGLAGCASKPADRIAADRATFEAWPADVQEKVAAGEIAVGFTAEQVRMALGEPSRVVKRTGQGGERTVWDFAASKPGFSIGLGMGGGSGNTSVGGGVGFGSRGGRELVQRVVLADGVVESIEAAAKE